MRLLQLACATAALIPNVWATSTSVATSSRRSGVIRCTVYVTSASVAQVPTSTLTTTLSSIVVQLTTTSVPSVTVTPPPFTYKSTVRETATVLESVHQDGGTITSTSTVVQQTTRTSTVSEVVTSTSTTTSTTLSVSLVPTSPGFVGILGSSFGKRDEEAELDERSLTSTKRLSKLIFQANSTLYPSRVVCLVNLQDTITYTTKVVVAEVTVFAKAATVTVVRTSTVSSTSTIVGVPTVDVEVTTTTSTYTIVATQRTTVTSVTGNVVVLTRSTSSYQACATNFNLLGPTDSQGSVVTNIKLNDPAALAVSVNATSPYDCCVACLRSTTFCEAGAFSATLKVCKLVIDPTNAKTNPGYIAGSVVFNGPQARYNITAFNGPAGELTVDTSVLNTPAS